MKILRTIVWLLPIGGVCLAGVVLVGGFASASGAPQEAVVAALACALAILPYCLSRSISEIIDTWHLRERTSNVSRTDVRESLPRIQIGTVNPWMIATLVTGVIFISGFLVIYLRR
jgi:uncharacterized membrane protein